ncbi:hypothetical protein C6500_08120 [Candidatus Poribacteria bacterium]|nr:MAG: hypothetical protein C6500_08120 [Candidatus Poribacteria bacterium]
MKLYEGFSTGIAVMLQEKMRSALTMLGIIIGVAAVLAMLAIGDGANRIVMQEFEKYGSHFTIRRNPWIWRGDRVFPNRSGEHLKYEDVLAIEAECPAVESMIPSIAGEVLAQAEGGATKWTEYDGVNAYFPTGMNWQIQQGRFFSEDEFNNRRKVCVLGLEVATELFGDQNPTGKEIKISLQGGSPDRFRILGVMAERGTSLQYGFSWDDIVFIPLTTAQDRFKGTHYVNYLSVRATDADSIKKAAEEVKTVLRKRHRNQNDFFDISFHTTAVKELDKISRIIKIMLSSIAGFSLFVGSVGIMNMMLVSVNQRTREIGIRRAIGAKRRDILLQFLFEAVVMCSAGGLLGILLGIGTGYLCSHIAVKVVKVIPQWPVVISLHWMAVSVSISACIGIVFGLYPAIRASYISPLEALRTD